MKQKNPGGESRPGFCLFKKERWKNYFFLAAAFFFAAGFLAAFFAAFFAGFFAAFLAAAIVFSPRDKLLMPHNAGPTDLIQTSTEIYFFVFRS